MNTAFIRNPYKIIDFPIDLANLLLPTLGKTGELESLFVFLKSKNCNIINQKEISNFLNKYIEITDYLDKAPGVIFKKFGTDISLNLELFFDPELEKDEGELFLNIETNLNVKSAHEKMNEIDKEWLIPVVGKNVAKFNLSLDFI